MAKRSLSSKTKKPPARSAQVYFRPATQYSPNHVPLARRLFYSVVSLTWLGWALIGIFSGHMFVALSKKGITHVSGIPALIFCTAVLASAAACSVTIFDHYDQRNNEKTYQRMSDRFWWLAAIFLVIALLVGWLEHMGSLPWTDGKFSLLSAQQMLNLPGLHTLGQLLLPYLARLEKLALIALLCMCALGLLMKLVTKRYSAPPSWIVWPLFPIMLVTCVSFALSLIATHADWLDNLPKVPPVHEDHLKYRLAWIYSMLLTCIGAVALLIMAFFIKIAKGRGLLVDDIW